MTDKSSRRRTGAAAALCVFLCLMLASAGGAFASETGVAPGPEPLRTEQSQPPRPQKQHDGIQSPVYPPRAGEFYPTSPSNFPEKMENPYARPRTVAFTGNPLEIFLQTDMVTQIQFPAPPLLVNIGRADSFVVETIPEFNSLFIKPTVKVAMTNLIVTTERGVYTFMLKENPWKPFDIRVVVTDPYRQVTPDDTHTLLWMAYNGIRPPEFQFLAMEIRDVNNSQYVYDPTSGMGSKVTVKRVVALPKANKSVYWVEFMNVLPPDLKSSSSAESFMVDEKSVWTHGISEVAVPGTSSGGVPLLGKGDKVDMFLVVDNGAVPSMFSMRFMMQGSPRDLPVEAKFSMQVAKKSSGAAKMLSPGEGNTIPADESVDDKLRRYYERTVKKEDVPTYETYEGPKKPDASGNTSPGTPDSGPNPSSGTNPPPSGEKIFFIQP